MDLETIQGVCEEINFFYPLFHGRLFLEKR